VRDAVKKKLPKEAPKPGKFRVSESAEAAPTAGKVSEAPAAPAEKEGA
jgi:large subunit ribosomal protein L3